MKILSLFDGMSCGQIAINKLGITDYTYYASEIDKFAMQVTKENYPNTIQIGDVKEITYWYGILKGEFLEYDVNKIDLLLGGSPCQGFSFAGKQLNFEDERSKLFFEYVRILKEVKPKYFLLENVKMKKEYQKIISEQLFGIQPVEINSTLVSAQNRPRLYWIGELQENGTYKQVEIKQPEDRKILIKDILEENVDKKYYLTKDQVKGLGKYESQNRFYSIFSKSPTVNTCGGGHRQVKIAYSPRTREFGTTLWRKEKCPCLSARDYKDAKYVMENEEIIRKATPTEYEALQTVPLGYTKGVSDTQRYKMLGNGWTVDVIAHILSQLKI